MLLDRVIFWLDLGLITVGLLVVMLIAIEGGFRLGRRARRRTDDPTRAQFTAIEGAELTVVGLILAFAFGMAITRFESRRQIVVNESNAIGTAYLRAALLPPPQRQDAEALLRRYVDAWLELHDGGPDQKRFQAATRELDQLQTQLWSLGSEAARQKPELPTMALFLQALNDSFDRQSELKAAISNRVPGLILLLLILGAVLALGQIGYGCGLTGRRNLSATITLCLLVAAIILVTLDLDRPRQGFLQLDAQSMIALRQSMTAPGS